VYRRLLSKSLLHQPLHSVLIALVAGLASCVLTALLSVTLPVEDELEAALRSFGANLAIEPSAGAASAQALDIASLDRLGGIMWRNRIAGVDPVKLREAALPGGRRAGLSGSRWRAAHRLPDGTLLPEGLAAVSGDARLTGRWPAEDAAEIAVGRDLAAELGLRVGQELEFTIEPEHRRVRARVSGILEKSGEPGARLWMDLAAMNGVLGEPGTADRIQVAALTSPEDWRPDFDPRRLTPRDFDRWYCRPTVSSVSYQMERALPGARVRVLRRVSETSADLVRRARATLWTLAALGLLAAAFTIAAVRRASLSNRRMDIGLLRSLGATDVGIVKLFFGEALVLATAGFVAGFPVGFLIAQHVGRSIFGVAVAVQWIVAAITLLATATLACLGSWSALHRALRVPPIEVLRT